MKVFDTSAIVALVLAEPGADAVARDLLDGAMSVVNLSETITVLRRKGMSALVAKEGVEALGLGWLSPSRETALQACDLSIHRRLSLGDRFCIASAIERKAPVVTGDRVWATLNLPVTVELIR